jgi:hypothetical protein
MHVFASSLYLQKSRGLTFACNKETEEEEKILVLIAEDMPCS